MSARPWSIAQSQEARETIVDLRRRLGLFSFQHDTPTTELALQDGPFPGLGVRPGGIVEWLAAAPGAGACAPALQAMSQPWSTRRIIAIVDSAGECYAPAFSGWGINLRQILFIRPTNWQEAWWAIEQCLRCPGVSATWAWVEQRIPTRVCRRWQLAAEEGGGVGILFRPAKARRESVWADLRLLVTPRPGGQGERRQVQIDVLYRRGGVGGTAQVWEIDHAEGALRLVPQMADPAAAEREART